MKHIKYLRYLVLHKLYVARACFRFGLYWRGLKHDWSKVLPSEWFPYVESFYGSRIQHLRDLKKKTTISAHAQWLLDRCQTNFDRAWLKHQHRNAHHWQHWVLREDSGATKILEMPVEDAIEMYCDWEGAGLAITGKKDVVSWYEKNREKILLHPNTRCFVEGLIYG